MARVNIDGSPGSAWGGRASFSGAVVAVPHPASAVRGLLPPPLALAGDGVTHSVIFVFGELRSGGAHVGGFDVSLGSQYREVGVMVPFVHHPAEPAPLLFPHAMFADDLMAVALGNAFYGLRKRFVRIDWEGPVFRASDRGQVLFESSARLAGPWSHDIIRANSGLGRLREAFALPVIGLRSSGRYVCSRFDWDFRQAEACSLDADVALRLDVEKLGGASEAQGAFGVRRLLWRTSPPMAVGSQRSHA